MAIDELWVSDQPFKKKRNFCFIATDNLKSLNMEYMEPQDSTQGMM